MSFLIYDDAVTQKIKYWANNTDIHVYSPNDTKTLFQVIADETNDQPLKLPIIAIRRKSTVKINTAKKPINYDGMSLYANEDKTVSANVVPMALDYTIDIYTRYQEEADQLVRNIVFNIINTPEVHVQFMYNDTLIEHDSTFSLASEITDNSSISERLIVGQFTRYTLDISVSNAYLWDIRVSDNYKVSCDV